MPERLAYDEAMLFSAIRLKMPDLELKQGKVETITTQTSIGPVERPWGIEGGFAVVYKFRTRSGKLRALRCFRVPINQDMQFRYERISAYFHSHIPDITVSFKYYDAGILVQEQNQAHKQAYPVIAMDWIDGATLLEKVDELCRRRDSAGLKNIKQQWLALLATLRRSSIAHGDLAGVNVMVPPDGRLILVDYDGVYIPEFAGMGKVLLGQVDYQHSQASRRQFDEHMDDFSALVIYTALLALEVRPNLWQKYSKRDSQGRLLDTNLLFTQHDFKNPLQSALFQELERMSDARVVAAVKELKHTCLQPIDKVRFPFHLIGPIFERELASPRHEAKFERIEQPTKAAPARSLTTREQKLAEQTAAFVQACQSDDDIEIAAAYEAIDNFSYSGSALFTPQQRQRARLAQQRRAALARLHVALASKRPQQITTAYDPILDACKNVTEKERELLALARGFVQAYQQDDDDTLIAAYTAIQQSPYSSTFLLTAQEQQCIEQAQQRKEALITFQSALHRKRPQEIVAAYSELLDNSRHISKSEREQLALARTFIQADANDDEEALVAVATALEVHPYFDLTAEEQQRLKLAKQRQLALHTFQRVLDEHPDSAQRIVAAYDAPLLDTSTRITQQQRERVAQAQEYLAMYRAVQKGIAHGNDAQIRASYDKIIAHHFADFSPQEQQRIDTAFLSTGIEEALAQRAYSTALKLALDIQVRSDQTISNIVKFKLQKAIIHFIRQNDLTDLTVRIEARTDGNYALVNWHWPEDELIRSALIVWSPDEWPPRLYSQARLNSDGKHIWAERKDRQREGQCTVSIGHNSRVYVQGYTAMLDRWDHRERWRFADGIAPTSQVEAFLCEEKK